MDKKRARLYALRAVSQMIWQEINSPTGFTIPGEGGMFDEFGGEDKDQIKIYNALEDIRNEINRKIERTTGETAS